MRFFISNYYPLFLANQQSFDFAQDKPSYLLFRVFVIPGLTKPAPDLIRGNPSSSSGFPLSRE